MPAHRLRAFDDTDFGSAILEDRPLFDMQFEVCAKAARSDRFRSSIARIFQRIGKPDSFGILQFEDIVHR